MPTPDIKHCPICNLDLPISDFGFCRARRDGRNLYCKSCIRIKVTQSRHALKEYKAARRARLVHVDEFFEVKPTKAERLVKLAPVDRVRNAIRKGSRTQAEIAEETRLGKDEIGD